MTFNLTPQEFASLRERAGIPEGQTEGQIDREGVRAEWRYAGGVLEATVLHKPMLVPESLIEARFRAWAGLS